MNHAITVGGLLLGLGALSGIVCACFGLLMIFAGGMSDAGDDGTSGTGCVVFLVGAALLVGSIVGMAL